VIDTFDRVESLIPEIKHDSRRRRAFHPGRIAPVRSSPVVLNIPSDAPPPVAPPCPRVSVMLGVVSAFLLPDTPTIAAGFSCRWRSPAPGGGLQDVACRFSIAICR